MAQEAPNISTPPYFQSLTARPGGELSEQWHQYIAALVQIIADLQRRVTALGG